MAKMGSTVVMAVAAALAVAAVGMADTLPPSAADTSAALPVDTTPADVAPTPPPHAAARVTIPTTVRSSTTQRINAAFSEMVEHDGRPRRSCGFSVRTGVYRRPGAAPTGWVVTHRRVVLRFNRERRTFRFRAGCRFGNGTSGRGSTYQCTERYKRSWSDYCRRRQQTLLCAADEKVPGPGGAAAAATSKLPHIPNPCDRRRQQRSG